MKEQLKVLITVKTYPIPSAKYGELVCTAGVTEEGDFVRLYPVNSRDQPYGKQYRKYQWVEIDAERHRGRDSRKESYRPDCDTLVILGGTHSNATRQLVRTGAVCFAERGHVGGGLARATGQR